MDADELLAETRDRIEAWNSLGRDLCTGFIDAAERITAPV
jgi:hypothetical protein